MIITESIRLKEIPNRRVEISGYDEVFFRRYGTDNTFIWLDLTPEKKKDFLRIEKEIDSLYEQVKDFLCEEEYAEFLYNFLRPIENGLFAGDGTITSLPIIRFHIAKKGPQKGQSVLWYGNHSVFPIWYDREKRVEEAKQKKQEELELQKKQEAERVRKEKYGFNERNRHSLDDLIKFNQYDHSYIVRNRVLESVTTIIENLFPKFDTEYHAKLKAAKLGTTIQSVIEMWQKDAERSREEGTKMHSLIDKYLHGEKPSYNKELELFESFTRIIPLKPFRTEWAIYDLASGIAGTVDYIDYQNGKYTLYDWKRSEKLIANGLPAKSDPFGGKGLFPIEHIENCPYYHYALQLSFYRYILEKDYNIQIDKMCLGIFHPSYNKPYVLVMPYLKKEVETIINLREEIIV